MAHTVDNAPLSDTEGAERPVREQLKKASIAGLVNDETSATAEVTEATEPASAQAGESGGNGRLQRKRSFEEVEGEVEAATNTEGARHHTRKRSRDSTAEEDEINNGRKVSGERPREPSKDAAAITEINGEKATSAKRPGTPEQSADASADVAAEAVVSPKTKRSRLHSTTGEENGAITATTEKPEGQAKDGSEPTESTTRVPPTSGFANTAAVSPFGALAGSKSPSAEPPQTSQSAFASSGFGSLAASATSGFGAIGKTTGGFGSGGSFASGGKSPLAASRKENEKAAESTASPFSGALGQKPSFASAATAASPFAAASSGFGGLGSGLSSGFGSGVGGASPFGGTSSGGLTTFASGKPATPFGASSAKPFGAPADDDENENEENENEDESATGGVKSPLASQDDDEKPDSRFYEQHVETGEEDEETEYSCRAKLYNYTALEDGKKEWRERGLGVLRLNVNWSDGKPKARFLMRADGSHRVVLNTPVKKEINFGAVSGGAPQSGLMLFMGTIDGKTSLEMLQLKVSATGLTWWMLDSTDD